LPSSLEHKIKQKKATIAILGMGYVGLPLALSFARAGFRVTGIDISAKRIRMLRSGQSYIDDITAAELKKVTRECGVKFTAEYAVIRKVDCIVICVPTPLGKTKEPDLSFVLSAVESMSRHLKRGQLVVLESTTYPGTTEENIAPLIESKTGLKADKDFYVGFSPERVDPANRDFQITDIPKVIGGIGKSSQKMLRALYQCVFTQVVPVSSARAAEMVKLLENTFRSVNIGMVNEMAMICDVLDVDVWEVIEAARTKPFGFMPFYPGPGIGGHCINIDSMYLAWKVRLHGYEPRLIELAQAINDQMPHLIVERIGRILNADKKPIKNSKVFVLGIAYKKNVRDTRESPSLTIIGELQNLGAKITYHDPFVPRIKSSNGVLRSAAMNLRVLRRHDIILLLTDHDAVDYEPAIRAGRPILDTRNALRNSKTNKLIHKL